MVAVAKDLKDLPGRKSKKTKVHSGMKRAIDILGGRKGFQEATGMSQRTIHRFLYLENKVAPKWIMPILDATSGEIEGWELRPDLYRQPTND